MSKACLALIIKLFNSTKSFVYIPGKTLEAEKQRIALLQHGILPVLLHVLETTTDETLKEIIKRHVREDYGFNDVEWTVRQVDKDLKNETKEVSIKGEVEPRKEGRLDERLARFERRLRLANKVQRTVEHNPGLILSK